MKYLYTLLLPVLLFSGACEETDKPRNLIPEDTYINLLVELQLVKSYTQSAKARPDVVDSLQSAIYEKYGISREQFRESHNYYQKQGEEQKKRLDEAIETLRMDMVKQSKADAAGRADSAFYDTPKP